MSIFGGSERFPGEAARSPGPIYSRPDQRARGNVVMKADYRPVDESRKWGKRESWIGGSHSPHMPLVPKESQVAPGQYHSNINSVRAQAPKVSFPKSSRFLSQKVNASGQGHQRELMAQDSPGPKYNVNALTSNGGKTGAPKYSFAPPPSSPRSNNKSTRLPNVNSPRKGHHRASWLSVINHNGVLVMPASPAPPRTNISPEQIARVQDESNNAPVPTARSGGAKANTVFGTEHRFGVRHDDASDNSRNNGAKTPRQGQQRVRFVSTKHMRENMGEFSPGPIYTPYNPECSGGRLAPSSPSSGRREPPPSSPGSRDRKNPDANMSSRSSWLAGNVRKSDGLETVMMRVGDVPPGPGSYAEPRSSFATFSHNVKTRGTVMKATRPPPRAHVATHYESSTAASLKSESRESEIRTPEAASRGE